LSQDHGNLVAVTRQHLVDRVVGDLDEQWCSPRTPVSPMYIDGRIRTASKPFKTPILLAS
jgi:hypothetical protein